MSIKPQKSNFSEFLKIVEPIKSYTGSLSFGLSKQEEYREAIASGVPEKIMNVISGKDFQSKDFICYGYFAQNTLPKSFYNFYEQHLDKGWDNTYFEAIYLISLKNVELVKTYFEKSQIHKRGKTAGNTFTNNFIETLYVPAMINDDIPMVQFLEQMGVDLDHGLNHYKNRIKQDSPLKTELYPQSVISYYINNKLKNFLNTIPASELQYFKENVFNISSNTILGKKEIFAMNFKIENNDPNFKQTFERFKIPIETVLDCIFHNDYENAFKLFFARPSRKNFNKEQEFLTAGLIKTVLDIKMEPITAKNELILKTIKFLHLNNIEIINLPEYLFLNSNTVIQEYFSCPDIKEKIADGLHSMDSFTIQNLNHLALLAMYEKERPGLFQKINNMNGIFEMLIDLKLSTSGNKNVLTSICQKIINYAPNKITKDFINDLSQKSKKLPANDQPIIEEMCARLESVFVKNEIDKLPKAKTRTL